MKSFCPAASLLIACCSIVAASDVGDFCRIKGQETIKLTGIGMVSGLNGSGDSRFRSEGPGIFTVIANYGITIGNAREVTASRNMAVVSLTCEVSPFGGRDGDSYDCHVASIGTARSLRGGRLMMTALKSPYISDAVVYAMAEGPITIEDQVSPTTGRIKRGAVLWRDLPAPFLRCGDRVTLVINDGHGSFATAANVSSAINDKFLLQTNGVQLAKVIDARNVEVMIPPFARNEPGVFLGDMMKTSLSPDLVNSDAKIVVNEKTGTIVITGEVQLKPVLVSHRNLVVFPNAGGLVGGPAVNPYVSMSPSNDPNALNSANMQAPTLSMQQLLDAMNRAAVPPMIVSRSSKNSSKPANCMHMSFSSNLQ